MMELMTLERGLARFVDVCTSTGAGGPAPKCTIFGDLGLTGAGATGKQAGCWLGPARDQ